MFYIFGETLPAKSRKKRNPHTNRFRRAIFVLLHSCIFLNYYFQNTIPPKQPSGFICARSLMFCSLLRRFVFFMLTSAENVYYSVSAGFSLLRDGYSFRRKGQSLQTVEEFFMKTMWSNLLRH